MREQRTYAGLTVGEWVYLLVGSVIAGHEIFLTQTLTMEELLLALFFFGLLASSLADRTGSTGPLQLIAALTDLVRGRRP